jgi:hypothetical protein
VTLPWRRTAASRASAGSPALASSAPASSAPASSAAASSGPAASAGPGGTGAPGRGSAGAGGGALRAVLAEIRAARGGGVSLAEVARRVGISREEAEAMVDYWVARGALGATDIGRGCSSGGCGGCPSGTADGAPGCSTAGPSGPVLVAITVRPRG